MSDRGFDPDVQEVLLRGIKPGRVEHRDGMSNVVGYDIRAHMNRMFGFGRWDEVAVDPTVLLYEQETTTRAGAAAFKVAYRASRRIVVRDRDGIQVCEYEGSAVGESIMPDFKRGDAHDMAIKTAETQAFKRAAVNLGDQFGLSLYAKGSLKPVVGAVVGFVPTTGTATVLAEPDVVEEVHDVVTATEPVEDSPVSAPAAPKIVDEDEVPLDWSDPEPERMITSAQIKKMQTMFGKLTPPRVTRDEKLEYLSKFFGTTIGSSNELTLEQAKQVINHMEGK